MKAFTAAEVIDNYDQGFKGVVPNPAADRSLITYLITHGGYAKASDAIANSGLAGSGAGKVFLPYLAAMQMYPNCLPGGAQQRGSCVAWTTRNAALVSYCAYLMYGKNAERYVPPVVSKKACENGVASTEGIYWFRGYDSDGWQGSAAAEVAISQCGLLIRQPYPELDLDLTEYSPVTEGRWGAHAPPANVQAACKQHLCSNATVANTYEEVRDLLANGYAISTTGSEAFSKNRDDWGVCRRSNATWYHAMAYIACDDRPETIAKWGCGLVLVQNSWGSYLVGEDTVHGTGYKIPVGSFWARWKDVEDRYCCALGPAVGWPANKLPDLGLDGIV
jgi:hypothetical protein